MITELSEASFVVCDVETTGLSPKYENIIEIALIKIEQNKITEEYVTLINPKRFIPPFITSLTGIRNQDIVNSPTFFDVSNIIQEFIGDSIFVAHNATFDYNFLSAEFIRSLDLTINLKTLCTCRLARRIFPNLKSVKLETLSKHLNIESIDFHRAKGDALVTAEILLKLLEIGQSKGFFDTIPELLSFQFQSKIKKNIAYYRKSLNESLEKLTPKPGVYFFRDKSGEIIYIGKAKNLKSRVLSYFRQVEDDKVKKIIKNAHYLDFIETGSELSALLLEVEQIKKHKPTFNVVMKSIRNYSFIRLDTSEKYPVLEVTKKLSGLNDLYFGPFNKRETAEQALEVISKGTRIRECNNDILKRKRCCYLLDIERCLGPCINDDIDDEYEKEMIIVKDFLTGNNSELLNRLINKMKDFAKREKYEESTKIRDSVQSILNNLGKIKVLKEPINTISAFIFIYFSGKISDIIVLNNGIVRAFQEPSDMDGFLFNLANKYFEKSGVNFEDPVNIEKVKIIASFLVNKKSTYKVIYVKECLSVDEIVNKLEREL